MKKAVIVLLMVLLALIFTGCGQSSPNEQRGENSPKNIEEAKDLSNDSQVSGKGNSTTWPAEFSAWDVPILSQGTITSASNKSVSGDVMTQGVNVVVALKNVSKANFDAYCGKLENKGFVKSSDSLADIMLYYEKSVAGGLIKITLSYSADGTTIVVNNSAAAAAKETASAGKTQWPDSAKSIPEFTKGKYKETVEMGGGMYAITFTAVTEADLEQYRNTLKKAGFERQDQEDTEGYGKISKNTAFSVGFIISGDTLQIIVLSAKL